MARRAGSRLFDDDDRARRDRHGPRVKEAANRRMAPFFPAKQGRWPLCALRSDLCVLRVSLFSTRRTPRLHEGRKIESFSVLARKWGKRAKLLIALVFASVFAQPASAAPLSGDSARGEQLYQASPTATRSTRTTSARATVAFTAARRARSRITAIPRR